MQVFVGFFRLDDTDFYIFLPKSYASWSLELPEISFGSFTPPQKRWALSAHFS